MLESHRTEILNEMIERLKKKKRINIYIFQMLHLL